MFTRFSESARRVIFYTRREAIRVGGSVLTTEHLLLGLLLENSGLVETLLAPGHTLAALRQQVEKAASGQEKLPLSAEMRLTEPAQVVLTYAEEEADRLQSKTIDVPHVLLGLLRKEDSNAARILAQFGLEPDDVRLKVAQGKVSPVQDPSAAVVSAFYGIEIRFEVAAEAGPRLIAGYRGHMAVIEIDPTNVVRVIQGKLPPRAESMVLEWAVLRRDEIRAAWKAAKAGKKPPPIPPLE